MNIRNDISVRRQISMIPFIAFIGFFIMLAFEYQSSQMLLGNNQTVITQLRELKHVREIQGLVSILRVHEKEFLRTQGEESLVGVFSSLSEIRDRIQKIKQGDVSKVEIKKLAEWSSSLDDYQKQFADMSSELMSIGTSESMGIRGTMRNAIHAVEKEVKPLDAKIYVDLLQVRRHEKDFLLRHDPKYALLWEKSILQMRLDLSRTIESSDNFSIIVQTFERYVDSFRQLQEHLQDLELDRINVNEISNGLLTVMSSVFNQSTDKLALAANNNYDEAIRNFKRLALATALVGAIAFITARLVGNGISLPLHNISRAMQRLADGDLETAIPARDYCNEFGEMAESVEIFRNDARRRVVAETDLITTKAHIENIFSSMTDALFEVSSSGKIKAANPAADLLLDANPGGLVGLQMADFIDEDAESTKEYGILKLIQSGLEDRHAHDERGFYELLQDAPLPIAIANASATIEFANKIACEAFGYSADEMVGMPVEKLMPETARAAHGRHVDTYMKETEPRSMIGGASMKAVDANGQTIELTIGLMPLVLDGKQRVLSVFQREGIDPQLADIADSNFGRLFAGFDLDPRILRLLPSGTGATARDHTFRTINGESVPVMVSGNLLNTKDTQEYGAIFVARDVSERIAHQTELLQYKSTLDRVASKVYMFDPESLKLTYFNRAAERRISRVDQVAHNITPMDLDPTQTDESFRTMLQPLIDGTRLTVVYETEQSNPDGTITPEEVVAQLITPLDSDPKFLLFVADITERKKNEREIQKFKSTLDATEDAIFMFKPDTLEFIYLNQSARAKVGWDENGHLGKTPGDINPIFDNSRFSGLVAPLIAGTERSVTIETTGLNLKPSELTIELFEDDDLSESRFVLTCRDISERKKAEKQILLFKQALDASQDQVYMFHPDSLKFTYMNESGLKKSGWKRSDVKQRTLMDNNESFDPDEFNALSSPLLKGEKQTIIYEKTGKEGNPIEVTLQLLKPENQKARFVAYTRDITERKAIETAKSQFISTISHELRTPLTSIKGALGLLKAGAAGAINEKAGSLIGIALGNSDRLIRLINDILDFEKIEAGKMDFHLENMDLAEMIRQSVEANRSYGVKNDVKFAMRGVKKPIMIEGDSDRLMQVMANLLSNAAKFSDKGGIVTVSATRHKNTVRIAVKDTGAGIPEKAQATIFDKFTQADSSDKRAKGGTGLGLNIVKMMLEAHKSNIEFVSIEGKGTTFFFDMTLNESEASVEVLTDVSTREDARLLICEDDDDVATLLKIMLERDGYEAQIASDAATAKEMLKTGNFDGMTLDLGLPDQDGISLLRELRASHEFESLPVVVVSANAMKNKDKLQGDGVRVFDWIQKPIDQSQLKLLMHRVLRQAPIEQPKILHVEDESNIREIVKGILGDRACVTGVSNVADARKKLNEMRFDLVILDLSLPDGSGEDLLPLLNRSPQIATPALIFSATDAEANFSSGVQAALVKSRASNEDLLNVINAVINGGRIGHRTAAE